VLVVVDYGVGNLASVENMFRKIGLKDVVVSGEPERIMKASRILLPGVGSFDAGMGQLERSGLVSLLNEKALREKVPVLGICLGMQMLGRSSEEGVKPGLGWIEADTLKLRPDSSLKLKVPHMGWDYIRVKRKNTLIPPGEKCRFYFVHSYHVRCERESDVLATCDFGGEFTCMVNKENIYGAQFHPEKSHAFGMSLLRNFSKL
jgi:imidazole glycerol-phosphate synthase subunit HisH